jgi:hypothetical protein
VFAASRRRPRGRRTLGPSNAIAGSDRDELPSSIFDGGDAIMLRESWARKELLLLFLVAGFLLLGATALWASQPSSVHVLFTGNATAHLEPSG